MRGSLKRKHALFAAICLLAVLVSPALAHRANVFAWVESGMVHGEASFSGGKPAMNSGISVLDAATGEELLTVATDEAGAFKFPVPEEAGERGSDLEIVLDAGMGHRDSWVVKAEEYGAAPGHSGPGAQVEASPGDATSGAADTGASPKRLENLAASIEALERRIDEMSRTLARGSECGPGVTEILGGIGYIIGLIGLAAYFRSRK